MSVIIYNHELIKFCVFLENLRLTERTIGKSKRHKSSNIVDDKKKKIQNESKQDTAEYRINRELEKLAAYQVRLAKRNNKQKKIKVMDESNRDFARKGIISYYLKLRKNPPIFMKFSEEFII